MLNFQKLLIWQKSHSLTLEIFKISTHLPKEELYGLISQMRRSSTSIPTNIAEGSGRESKPDFKRFLIISLGSASELEYQLILLKDLHFITNDQYQYLSAKVIEVRKMIYSYSKKL